MGATFWQKASAAERFGQVAKAIQQLVAQGFANPARGDKTPKATNPFAITMAAPHCSFLFTFTPYLPPKFAVETPLDRAPLQAACLQQSNYTANNLMGQWPGSVLLAASSIGSFQLRAGIAEEGRESAARELDRMMSGNRCHTSTVRSRAAASRGVTSRDVDVGGSNPLIPTILRRFVLTIPSGPLRERSDCSAS